MTTERELRARLERERRRRRAVEDELGRLVGEESLDPVTGLVTRTALVGRLGSALTDAAHAPHSVGLVLLDLDGLDALPEQGSLPEVLASVGGRLVAAAGPGSTVARVGSDEFAILLPHTTGAAALRGFLAEVLALLAEPLPASGVVLRLSASSGLSLATGDEAPETVLREAEAALYVARNGEGPRSVLFEAARVRRAAGRQFEADLRNGLDNGLITPWFQPVVELRTGEVIGTEALARWTRPDGSLRTTTEFVGLAEDHGLMPLLTDHILRAAATSVAASSADPAFLLHVNISGRELGQTHFPARVRTVLEATGLPPTQLCLEITERALVTDSDTTRANLATLRESGVRLAIDDFGVEYSSFGYLRRFPVDILKIDRSFITDIAHDDRDRALVSAMVAMSRALGIRTVAEGVEHVDQAAVLAELGVDEAQGWLFGRPAPLLIAC